MKWSRAHNHSKVTDDIVVGEQQIICEKLIIQKILPFFLVTIYYTYR